MLEQICGGSSWEGTRLHGMQLFLVSSISFTMTLGRCKSLGNIVKSQDGDGDKGQKNIKTMMLSKAVKEEATTSIKVQKMQGDDQWLSNKCDSCE